MASDFMNPVKCNICDAAAAKFHCNSCGDDLCPTCKTHHLKSKGSRHHHVVPYAQKLDPNYLAGLSCHIHPNNAPEFWCETCDVPICVTCITDKHKSHACSNLTTMLSEKRDNMVEEMKTLRDKFVIEWEGVLKQVQENTAGYLEVIEKTEKDLVTRAKQMHKQVDVILTKNQQSLQQMKATGLAKLQEQEKYLADRLQKLREELTYENQIREADPNVLLQFREDTKQKGAIKPPSLFTPGLVFNPGQNDAKLLEEIFGQVSEQDVRQTSADFYTKPFRGKPSIDSVSTERMRKASLEQSSNVESKTLLHRPSVQFKFPINSFYPLISCIDRGLAWVSFDRKELQLLDKEGSVKDKIKTRYKCYISDIEITSNGEIILADRTNCCIKSIWRQRKFRTLFQTNWNPTGLCCLQNKDIVVTFCFDSKVIVYSKNGHIRNTLDHIKFRYPRKVAVNKINHDIYTLCPKSPSARGLVACLPVRLLFKSTKHNAFYPV